MLTDDEIRDRFHARLDSTLAPVQPKPSLLGDVRRARRRQRTTSALAATGVTVGVTAAVAVPLAISGAQPSSHGTATVTPGATPTTTDAGPVARILSYEMQLPSGYRITVQPHVVDLNQQPRSRPQPVGGTTADFAAARGSERVDVTVYHGPIAAAEKTVIPPAPQNVQHTTVNGHPAVLDPYGTPPAGCNATQPTVTDTTRPTPQTTIGMRQYTCRDGRTIVYPTDEPVESRIDMPNGDLVWVETAGMPLNVVRDLLAKLIP